MSNERQLAEPSASLAQRTGVTVTLGGLPSCLISGRTCNSLRISTEPNENETETETETETESDFKQISNTNETDLRET
jgi:hypothetical protein